MKDLRSYITDRKEILKESPPGEDFEFINDLIRCNFNLNYKILDCFDNELIRNVMREEFNFYFLEDIQWYVHLSDYLGMAEEALFMFVFHSILEDAKLLYFDYEDLYVPVEGMEDDEISPDIEDIEEDHESNVMVELMKQENITRIKSSQIDCQIIIDASVDFVEEHYEDFCDEDGTYKLFVYCVSSKLLYELCKDKDVLDLLLKFLGAVEIVDNDESKTSYIYCCWMKTADYGNNDFNFHNWFELNKMIKEKTGLEYSEIPQIKSEKLKLLFSGNSSATLDLINAVITEKDTKVEVMF